MHGSDCGAPPATFQNNGSREMAVFQCRDHIMTSTSGTPYGVIYLTPSALADWSSGSTTISWNMSTARSSQRDWVDLWITPWNDVLDLPGTYFIGTVDLNGAPRNALTLSLDLPTEQFKAEVISNGNVCLLYTSDAADE